MKARFENWRVLTLSSAYSPEGYGCASRVSTAVRVSRLPFGKNHFGYLVRVAMLPTAEERRFSAFLKSL